MAGLWIVWRMAVFAALSAVAMGIVLPCIALVRHTTVHDWYAVRKLTQTELMIWVGFDQFAPIEYRTRAGPIVKLSRFRLSSSEAWVARERILSTIGDHAVMGAWAGFGSVILFLVLLAWLDRGRPGRGRTATVERAVAARSSAARRQLGFVDGVAPYDGAAADAGLLVVPGGKDRGSGGGSWPRRSRAAADGFRASSGRGQRQSYPSPGVGEIRREAGSRRPDRAGKSAAGNVRCLRHRGG